MSENTYWTPAQIEQECRPADKMGPPQKFSPEMQAFLDSIPKMTIEEALYGGMSK